MKRTITVSDNTTQQKSIWPTVRLGNMDIFIMADLKSQVVFFLKALMAMSLLLLCFTMWRSE